MLNVLNIIKYYVGDFMNGFVIIVGRIAISNVKTFPQK